MENAKDRREQDVITTTINYIIAVRENCPLESITSYESSEDFNCEREQMSRMGLDADQIIAAYEDSFFDTDHLERLNMYLEEDSIKVDTLGLYLHPGLTINDVSYRGYLEGPDV